MIKRRRFSEDIADSVLDKVIEMGLKPGDRLPTHSQLSDLLGVSLPSLREGLSLLSLSGVINITHGAGTTLVNPGPDDYFKMLAPASRIHGVDMDILSDYCSLFIIDLVEVSIKRTDILLKLLKSMVQSSTVDDDSIFMDLHREIHTTLASGIENSLKQSSFLIALNLFYSHPSVLRAPGKVLQFYLKSHISLMNSLQSGDKHAVTEALAACYRFRTLQEDSISLVYDSFGTGSLGGSFYSMARRFSNLFMNEESINIHPELTGGGVENVELMEEGKTLLALTQLDIAEAAYRAKGLFSQEHTHLRIICEVKPLDLYIVTCKDRNITNLYDLKGRRIAMGAEGGGSGIIARTILQKLEFESGDYRPYYLSLSNALQGLNNNEIDVVFFLAHDMPFAVKDLADEKDLKFIPIPKEILNYLEQKSSFWKRSSFTLENSYLDKIDTISLATVLITGSSVSEELICRIAEILKNKSDKRDQISFSLSDNNISIPFHTGVLECLK